MSGVREERTRRERIEAILKDSIADLLYYDRKEDEDLPRGAIQEAVAAGEISLGEMVGVWTDALKKGLES